MSLITPKNPNGALVYFDEELQDLSCVECVMIEGAHENTCSVPSILGLQRQEPADMHERLKEQQDADFDFIKSNLKKG